MKTYQIALAALCFAITSCGGEQTPKEETAPVVETPAVEIPEVAELSISSNDAMLYSMKRLDVYEGQKVKLTFSNQGTQPKETMGHNWTLLKEGVNLEEFAVAAIAAKETDYQPVDRSSDVVAYTPMLGPGEEYVLEFDAPSAGIYKFLCTFPGHYGAMQGVFVVKERP